MEFSALLSADTSQCRKAREVRITEKILHLQVFLISFSFQLAAKKNILFQNMSTEKAPQKEEHILILKSRWIRGHKTLQLFKMHVVWSTSLVQRALNIQGSYFEGHKVSKALLLIYTRKLQRPCSGFLDTFIKLRKTSTMAFFMCSMFLFVCLFITYPCSYMLPC